MLHIPQVIFGTLREHYVMLFGAAGAFSATCGFTAAWIGARFGARRALQEGLRSTATPPDHRIDQLVVAIDAIALEVERMSEGQRFTARLLSERAAEARAAVVQLPRREAGTVTPH